MSDQPHALACKHGSLRRSCEICDLSEEVDKLESEIADLRDTLQRFQSDPAYDVGKAFGMESARAEIERLNAMLKRSLGFVVLYRQSNPIHEWDGKPQDPCGAHQLAEEIADYLNEKENG